ncbi:MAG: hypothetical protein BWY43_00166 [candidate division WS2 bacterium ADurb.Bin280]|uniref:DUF721 domain-containing protein n=1 Tax=candidate division WS2 bacterium ADurb.Bin280 TaxID=1852829 RepID=A0A1V5SF98_9BACT|nr:MAG: hypothetical protein BWY43_00166 [candidate division WS2 bacterium ADurb.Bin280]
MGDEKVSQILKRRLLSKGLFRQAHSARVCAISDEVGGGEFVSVSYKNGVLKIKSKSGASAYLLKVKQQELIHKINDTLGSQVVKRVVICLGD